MGILGGLGMVIVNLTKQTSRASAKYQFDTEVQSIANEIMGILSDPVKCNTTFTAKDAASTTTGILNIAGKFATGGAGYGAMNVVINSYALSNSPSGLDTNQSYLIINFKSKNIINSAAGATTSKMVKITYVPTVTGGTLINTCVAVASGIGTSQWTTAGSNIYYSAGKVGIGTTAPTQKLDVSGNINATGSISTQSGATGYFGMGLSAASSSLSTTDLDSDRPGGNPIYRINSHTGLSFSAHSAYGGIRFYNQGYSATNPNPYDSTIGAQMVMAINNGAVGIGTNAPAVKLDVNGSIRPGSTGISTNGACSPEGAFAYDMSAHAPVYCNSAGKWTAMGGGNGFGGAYVTGSYLGGGCYPNPKTGACSCPTGTIAHDPGGALYTPGGVYGELYLCY